MIAEIPLPTVVMRGVMIVASIACLFWTMTLQIKSQFWLRSLISEIIGVYSCPNSIASLSQLNIPGVMQNSAAMPTTMDLVKNCGKES